MDGAPAELDHWHDIGLQRVPNHHELRGIDPAALEDAAVGVDVLLTQDLDADENFTKA
jgi:hypothetical protein